jgi:hypothetical protein|tara:strand:+ start:4748 stop:7168 length:2421 start_codon:yes stop_codon:yes gene_type:complete
MATYVNDLRLKEIATGDEAGTWGTSTNTNLELIAEAFSFGTEAITTNANTHTTTIADGSTDPGRSIFLKYTGALDSDCTITIGPNTVSKLWFIENATTDSGSSGPYNIIIKQGTGATVTVPNSHVKAIYSDGAGSGGAMVEALTDLNLTDSVTISGSTPTLTIGDAGAEDTKIVFDGNAQDYYIALDDSADDLLIGLGSAVGTTPAIAVDENLLTTLHGGLTLVGTTPTLTIGDAGAEDTKIVFDGNAQDFYIGLDDSADDLVIGKGSAVGTTPAIEIDENLDIKFAESIGVGQAASSTTGDITAQTMSLLGTTPTLTLGDGGEEDVAIKFNGVKDFYIANDDSADKLVIGEGSTVGTNNILTITDDSLTIGDGAAVDTKVVFDGSSNDYYLGLDVSTGNFDIGEGSTVGTNSAISIDSAQNVDIAQTLDVGGALTAQKLTSNNGILELDDNGTHNGIINVPASLSINIDSDDGATTETFTISKDKTAINDTDVLFRVKEDGNVGVGIASPTTTSSSTTAVNIAGGILTENSGTATTNFTFESRFSGSNNLTLGYVGNGSTHTAGQVAAQNNLNLVLATGGSATATMNSSGNMNIGGTPDTTHRLRLTAGTGAARCLNMSSNNAGLCATTNNESGTGAYDIFAFTISGGSTQVGGIVCGAGGTAFNTSSDYRLKENVNYTWDATTRLKQLKPARFNWTLDETDTTVDGFLAHEVEDIVPEAITGAKDATETLENVVRTAGGLVLAEGVTEAEWIAGKETDQYENDSTWTASLTRDVYQTIDQAKLVPLLVKTIQELEARITTLESA